ncbi:MAG: flagellar basal body rod protein FlgC [Candidatus Latescibacteria bacterium]|nr:flagellar basal body rod protein FlgC [Candidatus Latescibacterota bacterium]
MKFITNRESLFRGNIYRSIDIAGSGMTAQRKRMDAVSSNIANISVTNADGNGNPYLRRHVVMKPDPEQTFSFALKKANLKMRRADRWHMPAPDVVRMEREKTPLVKAEEIEIPNMRKNVVYEPTHPDADENGYVTYPDINNVEEMVDLMVASRAFEANVTVVNAAKQMITKSLEI